MSIHPIHGWHFCSFPDGTRNSITPGVYTNALPRRGVCEQRLLQHLDKGRKHPGTLTVLRGRSEGIVRTLCRLFFQDPCLLGLIGHQISTLPEASSRRSSYRPISSYSSKFTTACTDTHIRNPSRLFRPTGVGASSALFIFFDGLGRAPRA